MNKRIPLALLVTVASGCASGVNLSKLTTGGTGAGATGSSSGSSSGDAGLMLPTVGEPCSPVGVKDVCTAGGLICDAVSATCRLPELGEQCGQDAGCASSPTNLGCYSASLSGIPESVCLIPCTPSDSSGCPYGTSCGDPNLMGFCSAEGTPECTPWGTCSLGGGISGSCIPDGTHPTCFAFGSQSVPYAPCDPFALNSDTAKLCAAGMACLSVPLTLGGAPGTGFCYPLCGGGDGGSLSMSCVLDGGHCDQPAGNTYGVCRPGTSCTISADTCGFDSLCVPDSPDSLSGGCLWLAADAGGLGEACGAPVSPSPSSTCQHGACLAADAGDVCADLCDLADGGEPPCPPGQGVCTALTSGTQTDVVGACR